MRLLAILLCGIVILAPAWCLAAEPTVVDERAAAEFFEKKIRPLLAKRCYECHAHDKAGDSGQLAVDSRAALLKGGDRGPIIVACKPDESLLLKAVKYGDPKLQMPPEGKLPDAEIDLLSNWIANGAFVPEYGVAAQKKGKEIDWPSARQFWSFRPLERGTIPEARSAELGARSQGKTDGDVASSGSALRAPSSALVNPLDSFIVAKLHENGLAPSSAADKRTLIRRLAFDLIGLPPSPDEVAEFLADERPDAYERLVDRLLASPHFGERWARYWLDLARYVDDTPDWQKTTEQAWLYRDWVVRAFNEDRPYDEFVKLQLSADVMPDTAPEDYAALGFVGLSPQYWKELKLAPSVIEVIVADEWDERLDAVSRTFLGLTVACARCHDHKFDAITTRDYYALAGVFASTDLSDRPLLPSPTAELVREARHKVDSLKESLKKTKGKESEEAQQLQQQIVDLREATPYFDTPMAPTIEEASVFVMPDGPDATKLDIRKRQSRDLPIFRRGNPGNPGDIVPRRFLELFSSVTSQPFQQGSGRREFAEALVHEAQALSARVIVNRIWSHHFGKGLVRTPSDFGQQGERPSHPELLEWLSGELVGRAERGTRSAEQGASEPRWSLKRLHRQLVTSATYRQLSIAVHSALPAPSSALALDPDNHLLWRMNRRRLDIEPWRDAMLAVAGNLNDAQGGPALNLDLPTNRRRTLYGKIGREEQHDMLRTFDFPPPTSHSPARDATTTPLQQLFVLNSSFVAGQAEALVALLNAETADASPRQRLARCYQLLFQRAPREDEIQLGERFLTDSTIGGAVDPNRWRLYIQSLLGLNEFLFVD
ncbi:MAG: PSD1 and planctomycete cytochrome C domain-containing protein [Planctomycetota bacterium]